MERKKVQPRILQLKSVRPIVALSSKRNHTASMSKNSQKLAPASSSVPYIPLARLSVTRVNPRPLAPKKDPMSIDLTTGVSLEYVDEEKRSPTPAHSYGSKQHGMPLMGKSLLRNVQQDPPFKRFTGTSLLSGSPIVPESKSRLTFHKQTDEASPVKLLHDLSVSLMRHDQTKQHPEEDKPVVTMSPTASPQRKGPGILRKRGNDSDSGKFIPVPTNRRSMMRSLILQTKKGKKIMDEFRMTQGLTPVANNPAEDHQVIEELVVEEEPDYEETQQLSGSARRKSGLGQVRSVDSKVEHVIRAKKFGHQRHAPVVHARRYEPLVCKICGHQASSEPGIEDHLSQHLPLLLENLSSRLHDSSPAPLAPAVGVPDVPQSKQNIVLQDVVTRCLGCDQDFVSLWSFYLHVKACPEIDKMYNHDEVRGGSQLPNSKESNMRRFGLSLNSEEPKPAMWIEPKPDETPLRSNPYIIVRRSIDEGSQELFMPVTKWNKFIVKSSKERCSFNPYVTMKAIRLECHEKHRAMLQEVHDCNKRGLIEDSLLVNAKAVIDNEEIVDPESPPSRDDSSGDWLSSGVHYCSQCGVATENPFAHARLHSKVHLFTCAHCPFGADTHPAMMHHHFQRHPSLDHANMQLRSVVVLEDMEFNDIPGLTPSHPCGVHPLQLPVEEMPSDTCSASRSRLSVSILEPLHHRPPKRKQVALGGPRSKRTRPISVSTEPFEILSFLEEVPHDELQDQLFIEALPEVEESITAHEMDLYRTSKPPKQRDALSKLMDSPTLDRSKRSRTAPQRLEEYLVESRRSPRKN